MGKQKQQNIEKFTGSYTEVNPEERTRSMVITITAILTSILDFKSENSILKLKSLETIYAHFTRFYNPGQNVWDTLCFR